MSEAAAKIRRLCRVLTVFCVFGMALIVLAIPVNWIDLGDIEQIRKDWLVPDAVPLAVPGFWLRLACVAVTFALFGPAFYALVQLRLVLRQIRRGVLFDASNVARLRRLGWAIMAAALGDIAYETVIPTLLILANARSMGHFRYDLADGDFVGLFAGGVVLLIARVLDAAREISDENAQII